MIPIQISFAHPPSPARESKVSSHNIDNYLVVLLGSERPRAEAIDSICEAYVKA